MFLARKVVGFKGIYTNPNDDIKRQKPNTAIRELLGISNTLTELRVRRLKWLEDILKSPMDNTQLRAALVGPITTS